MAQSVCIGMKHAHRKSKPLYTLRGMGRRHKILHAASWSMCNSANFKQRALTKVKLFDTCLNRIFHMDTPGAPSSLFGPSRARRDDTSALCSPWLKIFVSTGGSNELMLYKTYRRSTLSRCEISSASRAAASLISQFSLRQSRFSSPVPLLVSSDSRICFPISEEECAAMAGVPATGWSGSIVGSNRACWSGTYRPGETKEDPVDVPLAACSFTVIIQLWESLQRATVAQGGWVKMAGLDSAKAKKSAQMWDRNTL